MGGIIGIAKLTGNAAYSATVQSCYTDVTISCGTYTDIGGIVGRSAGSTISGCWTSGDI